MPPGKCASATTNIDTVRMVGEIDTVTQMQTRESSGMQVSCVSAWGCWRCWASLQTPMHACRGGLVAHTDPDTQAHTGLFLFSSSNCSMVFPCFAAILEYDCRIPSIRPTPVQTIQDTRVSLAGPTISFHSVYPTPDPIYVTLTAVYHNSGPVRGHTAVHVR